MNSNQLPTGDAITAWARLIRAQRISLGMVEARLKDAGLPSLEWYDVLLELERAGPLRPRDLQSRLLLAQPNVSRLLDRMERAGLVMRESCADDGRGLMVRLTASGRSARRKIWPVYAAGIQDAVGKKLSAARAKQLAELLQLLTDDDAQLSAR